MPKAKLTELSVARFKPPAAGRIEVWDSHLPAFGVRLTAAGGRSWIVALRKPGTTHPSRIKLGEPSRMTLAEARAKARELMADPGALVQPRREEPATVAAAADDFIVRYIQANRRDRSGREAAAQLRREFVSLYGPRPLATIGRREVIVALDRVTDRGAPIAANRLLANLSKFFGWAVDRGIIETTPVVNIKAPAKERGRDRVLEDDELAAIWRDCDGLGWPFGPLVRMLIITGQRRDEVARMAWADLDVDRRLWTLPRELTKADRVHEVPLSALAAEVIEAAPRIGDGLVFPSRRARSSNPVSGFSRAKARLDRLSGVVDWRIHDLRRTAASGMARLGHPPHVVAAILNHSPGATMGITAVYNRFRYTDEKRAALDAWAREVERIVGGRSADVIQLRSGAQA